MNIATLAYLPPKTVPGAVSFISNLKRFPPKGELVCFSDTDHDWPGLIKMRAPLDMLKGAQFDDDSPHKGKINPFAVNNGAFLVAIKIALEQKRTHMLYIESDCRVGAMGWDERVWDEYFNLGRVCIAAGTLSVYNACSSGREAAIRARELIALPTKHGIPVGHYGWTWDRGMVGAKDQAGVCVFPNGAPAVYDLWWMSKLWNLDNLVASAKNNGPFDQALGHKLGEMFGPQAYDVLGYLHTVYGGFGDCMTTELERQTLLREGKIAISHQHKGDWTL